MTYYIFVTDGKINGRGCCECKADDWINIEVTKEMFDNIGEYGNDYYIYDNGEIILNPDYEQQQLELARADKLKEALNKAYDYEQNGTVEYKNCVFEMSLANQNNLRNTQEALTLIGQTETVWNDKNDELVYLSVEDIQYIRLNLILGATQKLWIEDYPAYKTQILEAQTIEELENIEISYDRYDT